MTELRSCGKVEVAVLGPNSLYGLCGRKVTLEEEEGISDRARELCESRGGHP